MDGSDIAALWATYKIPLVCGVVGLAAALLLLRKAVRLARVALGVALGGAVGVGAVVGLTRLGLPQRRAGVTALMIALAVLAVGAVHGWKKG